MHNWGKPERAPHEREVWCQVVQYVCMYVRMYICTCMYIYLVRHAMPYMIVMYMYVYLSRTSRHAVHDSHVGAHMSNIVRARTLIDSRLDYQGYLWMLQNLSTERRDYGIGGNEKGHTALTIRPNKGNKD